MLYTSESIRPLTSIVSYPERGEGGNNKYRGNCSPKLIEDLIGFFKPSEICDYMCGSGTTGAAAAKCGISSKLYDLHSGFDLMNSEIPEDVYKRQHWSSPSYRSCHPGISFRKRW